MTDTPASLASDVLLAGRYRLVRPVGQGAVGHIWLARDEGLGGEPVAVKVLDTALAANRLAVQDLKREVLITRRLRHPNILGVYTLVETEQAPFITMEFIEGQNLAECLVDQGHSMPLPEVLRWLGPIAQALDYAHGQSILHRDIKAANILLRVDGHVALADFGIAQTVKQARAHTPAPYVRGTITCMSPEQIQGAPLDHRSDLYSLASTVYEALAGHPPFYEGDVMAQVQLRPPDPIPAVSESVNAVLMAGLAKRPQARPYSCGVFHDLLAAAAEHDQSPQLPEDTPPERGVRAASDTVRLAVEPHLGAPKRIGQMLVEAGLISATALQAALARQEATGERVGEALCALGTATEEGIAATLATQLRLARTDAATEPLDDAALNAFPLAWWRERRCLPVHGAGAAPGGLLLAMANPLDLATIAGVEEALGRVVDPVVVTPSAVMARLDEMMLPGT